MKLADFFIQLGVKGDTKELDKTIKQLEEAERATKRQIKYQQDLAKATSEEQKALIRKNYYQNKALDLAKKEKNAIVDKNKAFINTVKGISAIATSALVAYKAIDRMVNSLAVANSRMIAFQRQTGISFASLNKYASASASMNFNATPEQMANTMQTLASNLYDIRMGRGDISPYQELAFVGGKPFNPMGMSVEQLIESVREAIKGVGDVQATNLITRMGFSPDDLLMLRMTREEFEKINDLFLSPREREQMNAYSLQIKKMRLEFNLMKDRLIIALTPAFIKFTKALNAFVSVWGQMLTGVINFINKTPILEAVIFGLFMKLHPIIRLVTILYLLIEDIVMALTGNNSYLGTLFNFGYNKTPRTKEEALTETNPELTKHRPVKGIVTFLEMIGKNAMSMGIGQGQGLQIEPKVPYTNTNSTTNNTTQNFSIYTTESASVVENSLNFTGAQRQLAPQGY